MQRRAGARGRRIAARVTSGVVAVVIAVSALALGAVVLGSATQRFRLAPVLSGSMSPTIPKGSLVMAEPIPSSDIKVGDVLLFTPPIPGHPLVMHRIHDMSRRGGVLAFHTKGDANAGPDAWTIRVKGPQAWRVVHAVPYVGSAISWMSTLDVRIAVLVLGALILVIFGLRSVWARRPISWHADDPFGEQRRTQRRRGTGRALVVTCLGALMVVALGAAGLASAQFTASPTPPAPAFGSGQLSSPSTMTCNWSSATQVQLNWQNNSPTFTTGYNVRRSTTSGSGYATIGTTGAATTVTYTDAPSPVTTKQYYVTQATRSTWTSANSNETPSNLCVRALNLVAGTTTGFSGDNGQATAAQLAAPKGVAVDASGNVYIADTTNNRIRKVDGSTGVITTIAGGGATTACTYSGIATGVSLSGPQGVDVDASGNVYIADTGNNCIRKLAGSTISQVAGGGASTACTFAGVATGVSMSSPRGVTVDASGNIYIADFSRNCVRKVVGANISGVAGGGASTGCAFSGTATSATLSGPSSIAIDSAGNLYIADTTNNCIRQVTSAGAISLFAGNGATTACSAAAGATTVSLSAPTGVAVDSSGRVLIADSGRRCVRMVASGNISLLAGTGTSGSTGDNGPAIAALFTTPNDVATNASGDVWIVDSGTHRVRRVEGPV